MGNSCTCFATSSSSMEWDGEDWEFLKTEKKNQPESSSSSSRKSKVFDEGSVDQKENNQISIEKLRTSCDGNGKVTLKISKSEFAQLLEAIQHNNNTQQSQPQQRKQLASAEQVLLRLIKAKSSDHEFSNKNHCSSNWKPVLQTIPE